MLRGAGVCISLPLLDIMHTAGPVAASESQSVVRAAYLYIPNGVADGAWGPAQVDGNGRLLRRCRNQKGDWRREERRT